MESSTTLATRAADSPRPVILFATSTLLAGAGGPVLGLVAEWWGGTPVGNTALVVPFAGGPALLAGG